jgi:CRP/FNR family transcriptional regulator, cyclic AMP receptor protein
VSAKTPESTDPPDNTTLRSKRGALLARVLYEKDKVIFSEGHSGTDAYVVESGRVGIFKLIEGKPVRLTILQKGAMFGEMAAITNEPRSATAVALEVTTVVRISNTTIQHKLAGCDPFVKALLNILIANLNRTTESYALKAKVADQLVNDISRNLAD